MKTAEQIKQVPFDSIPECLIKLSWEAKRTRCFVVFHLEDSLSYFLFRVLSRKKVIFLNGNLGNIICLGFIHIEVAFLRCPKQIFVIIFDISFEIVHTLNGTFILNERMNTLLPMSAIGNTMEIASIRISLKEKLALGALVPFQLLLTEEASYLTVGLIFSFNLLRG
jgi:hypothetical protein